MKKIFITILFLLPMGLFAQPLLVGKDYQELKVQPEPAQHNKIQVTEFFSVSCHWCYQLQPELEKWLKTKPKDVDFSRVPVMFRKNWEPYARSFYVAKALGVEDKMLPILFHALHVDHVDFNDKAAVMALFEKAGVSKSDFDKVYSGSPTIDMELSRSNALVQKYRIAYIPTLIVDGRYKVDSGMAKGNSEKMIATLEYLIDKARTSRMMSMAHAQ